MTTVQATRKLLQRLGPPTPDPPASTSLLGDWYATSLPWRPHQIALLINERTLLPLLMPLAPARTLLQRFPDHLAELLNAHHTPPHATAAEIAAARHVFPATTNNRSLVGSLNEFAFLAAHNRNGPEPLDLLGLSLKLSRVPCGPLFKRHVSPDRELAALLHDLPPGGPVSS